MTKSLLTRTFGAAALATALYSGNVEAQSVTTNLVPVVSTNYLSTEGVKAGFTNLVSTNVLTGVVSTNNVFAVKYSNATPNIPYDIERRPFLEAGENLGHQWKYSQTLKGRPNGTISFNVGDYHPKQEFFRAKYFTTNMVEEVITNGAPNVN